MYGDNTFKTFMGEWVCLWILVTTTSNEYLYY